jgi:hypothetical protein
MTRQLTKNALPTGLGVAAVLILSTAFAGSRAEPRQDKPDTEGEIRRAAEQIVNNIEVEVLGENTWSKVTRIDQPLLFYGDSTRENDRGSLWAWGEKGRPVAVIELFQNTGDRANWVYTICNTSGRTVRARRAGSPWWRANLSATELKDVPGAPAPASDAPARQRQLKLLAQKFTGHEFWDPNNSRYELRRLERPLVSYRDETNGLLEGGLFTLANGTNPEILLFVESRVDPTDASKARWQYAVGRVSHSELHLEYDGREVFNSPRGDRLSGWDKPYWLGVIETGAGKK